MPVLEDAVVKSGSEISGLKDLVKEVMDILDECELIGI